MNYRLFFVSDFSIVMGHKQLLSAFECHDGRDGQYIRRADLIAIPIRGISKGVHVPDGIKNKLRCVYST